MLKALNRQEGGDHYKDLAIEPAEYIIKNNIPWAEGNAIKYLTRHNLKGGLVDVKKAIHFMTMVLETQYGIRTEINYFMQGQQ